MLKKVSIGVFGCLGRIGKLISSELVESNYPAMLSSAFAKNVDKSSKEVVDFEMKSGIKITNSIQELFSNSEIVIDFTSNEGMIECLKFAKQNAKPVVSGTTGINYSELQEHSKFIPILWSPNMSIGINVLMNLVKISTQKLKDTYDIEIWEMHHNHKKDAPSGTAIMLGRAAAQAMGIEFEINQYTANINSERKKNTIGFASSRGGSVVGDHKVMFVGEGECIELSHRAFNRNIFAIGAIKSALWLINKPNGLYSIDDVLNDIL